MTPPPDAPLFAHIGRGRRRTAAPPIFATFVAVGLAAAIGAFVWRWMHPPERVHAVRVDLVVTPRSDALDEEAAWSARRATAPPAPRSPTQPAHAAPVP